MERHWTRLSTWLVAFMGAYMLVNTVRATLDPAGFASAMGLPLTDPANHAFVQVYALRAAFRAGDADASTYVAGLRAAATSGTWDVVDLATTFLTDALGNLSSAATRSLT